MSMSLDTKPGDKIRLYPPSVHGYENGREHDKEHVSRHLSAHETYTVRDVRVSDFDSSVELREKRGNWFNTVMFYNVD